MTKLIIVCGLPGSGKTTLARELSKKTKIACIHKDSIKECLFDEFGFSTLEDSKRLGKPVVATLLRIAEEQMRNNIDVIIESPFNFSEDYLLFDKWQNDYEVSIYTVICSIEKNERKKRFQERERHRAHHDVDRQLIRTLDQQEYDYVDIPGKHIRVETNRPVNELAEEIISQLN